MASLGALAAAVPFELSLERRQRGVECEPMRRGAILRVKRRSTRNLGGDATPKADSALRSVLVSEPDANIRRHDPRVVECSRDLPSDQRSERGLTVDAFDF